MGECGAHSCFAVLRCCLPSGCCSWSALGAFLLVDAVCKLAAEQHGMAETRQEKLAEVACLL